MGQRGPDRKVGSVRWQREVRQKQRLAAQEIATTAAQSMPSVSVPEIPANLPTCPECLPKPVRAAFYELLTQAVVAGAKVTEFDASGFVIAAGQRVDLYAMESVEADELPIEARVALIGKKEQVRKSFLQTLVALGATVPSRMRARIIPEKKPETDEWSQI